MKPVHKLGLLSNVKQAIDLGSIQAANLQKRLNAAQRPLALL
jgi:hypothetical protein